MDVKALYHMLRLEVLHPKLFTFDRDGPLPLMWNNLTTRSSPLQTAELEALQGRTALIAGATSGCGLELAKILAVHCNRLIITARDTKRGQQALDEIQNSLPNESSIKAQIELWPLEMASFKSIREFAERLHTLPMLDIAILNAGIWHLHFAQTEDSFETHLQVNYLASCALTLALLTVLARGRSSPDSRPGRLLNVTSEGHALESIPTSESATEILDAFNDPTKLTCYQRYRLSKLLDMIWTHELASSMSSAKVEIASFTPGASQTQICRDLGTGPVVRMVMGMFCQSAEEGAWGYVRALGAEEYHGKYFFRESPCEPTDCVTKEKYEAFRGDLVRQTLKVLEKQVGVPNEVYTMLGMDSGSGPQA